MGEPILSYTSRIPDSSSSELVPYIKKLLNTGTSKLFERVSSGGG